MSNESGEVPPSSPCSPQKRATTEEVTPAKRLADTIMPHPQKRSNDVHSDDDDVVIIEQSLDEVEANIMERLIAVEKDLKILRSKLGSVPENIKQLIYDMNDDKSAEIQQHQPSPLPDYDEDDK